MRKIPDHGPCLVCGTENPAGMGFSFYMEGDRILGFGTLTRNQQGPPGHAHGGSLAAILDEAMGRLLWEQGHHVLAAHLDFDYRTPTPLDVALTVEAEAVSRGNRSIHTAARLKLPDGTVAVEGKGVFVELKDNFLARFGEFWGKPVE